MKEPLRSEAWAVAVEFVERARFNIVNLYERLLHLGYRFHIPDEALVFADAGAKQRLDDFEATYGTLPLVVRAWHEVFTSVNFVQEFSQRHYSGGVRPPAANGVFGLDCELVVWRLETAIEEISEIHPELRGSDKLEWFLPQGVTTPDCDGMGAVVPSSEFEICSPVGDMTDSVCFADWLRDCLRWGGSPRWKSLLDDSEFYFPYRHRPDFKSLLPVLTEGLLEL